MKRRNSSRATCTSLSFGFDGTTHGDHQADVDKGERPWSTARSVNAKREIHNFKQKGWQLGLGPIR